VLIRNVSSHPDDLHDGRMLAPFETAEITAEEFKDEHYQARLREGLIVVCPDEPEPTTVKGIIAAIEAAPDELRESEKARFRAAEELRDEQRQGVMDATEPTTSEE
jgi:hypothetical protein